MLAGATMFISWFYFFVKMAILICITIMCPKSCMEKLFVVAGLTLSVGYQQLNCAIAQVLLPVLFGFLHVPTVAGRTMSCKCRFKRGYNKYPHIHRISPYTQHSSTFFGWWFFRTWKQLRLLGSCEMWHKGAETRWTEAIFQLASGTPGGPCCPEKYVSNRRFFTWFAQWFAQWYTTWLTLDPLKNI